MWTELLERTLLVVASAILGFLASCAVTGPPTIGGPELQQSTSARQQTVQAAPGSVVEITESAGDTQPADP